MKRYLLTVLFILEQIIFWPTRIVMAWAIFLKHLRNGIYYGYPICCILHFAIESAIGSGRKRAVRRGGIHPAPGKAYVPCFWHQENHPQWKSFDTKNWP
jgi:hypothetical protein